MTIGRLTVPIEVGNLLLELDAAGLAISTDGADLLVRPSGVLTAAQRQRVLKWKRHLVAVLDQPTAAWLQ